MKHDTHMNCAKCGGPIVSGAIATIVYGTNEVLCSRCHPPPEGLPGTTSGKMATLSVKSAVSQK